MISRTAREWNHLPCNIYVISDRVSFKNVISNNVLFGILIRSDSSKAAFAASEVSERGRVGRLREANLELPCPQIMLVWEIGGEPWELVSVCERDSMGNACRRSPDYEA